MTLSSPMDRDGRFEAQASMYSFPYHWLPVEDGGIWTLGRVWPWGHEYLAVLGAVRELVLKQEPERVLDFGCGDGRLSHELLIGGVPNVTGIDLVERAIAFARALNSDCGDRADFRCSSIEELPEKDFDVAVAMEVLEHVADDVIPSVTEGLWARLKRGGCLVVSVPTTNLPLNRKHERHYTRELLGSQLAPYFEVDHASYVHRVGMWEELLRRLWVNRFTALIHPRAARVISGAYRRHVLSASPEDGAHLVAVCRRNDGS